MGFSWNIKDEHYTTYPKMNLHYHKRQEQKLGNLFRLCGNYIGHLAHIVVDFHVEEL